MIRYVAAAAIVLAFALVVWHVHLDQKHDGRDKLAAQSERQVDDSIRLRVITLQHERDALAAALEDRERLIEEIKKRPVICLAR